MRCASPTPVSVAVKSSNAANPGFAVPASAGEPLNAVVSRRQSRKLAGATARFGLSARVSHTTIRLPGSAYGSGRSTLPFRMVKIAVLAPMPSANEPIAARDSIG